MQRVPTLGGATAAPTLDRGRAVKLFAEALVDPGAAQERLLLDIVTENACTEFGQLHGFAEILSPATYRRRVAVATYADLAPFINRMMAGETHVLVPGNPVFFGRTSGTSGKPKHVGYPAATEHEYFAALAPMLESLERDHPGSAAGAVSVTGTFAEDSTATGIRIGSASGFVRNLPCFADEPYFHFTPEPVFELRDYEARYYAMLRFAFERPVRLLSALNPSSILTLFRKAAEHGEALADDIARGTLEAGPTALQTLPREAAATLRSNPAFAERLRASLRANSRFLPGEIWPDLAVIQTWKGGSSAHYLASLRELCPRCALRPAVSGSTEGLLLVPLADDWVGGVPALCSSVLEFFPEESEPRPENFVDVSDLADGRGYRVVLTNRRGMYRYLMDDVFYVEGRIERTPILRFSHRFGLTSSLTGEKLTEPDVAGAVDSAAAEAGLRLVDYQAAPEWGEPPRYVLTVEFAGREVLPKLAEFLRAFEEDLGSRNVEYRAKRDSARLAPPELIVLIRGEFDRKRRALAEGRSASDAQLKLPRLSRSFLNRSTLHIDQVVPWPVQSSV